MGRQNKYITVQGDTWDSIALRLFGNELLMWLLVDANPCCRGIVEFPANVELTIPEAVKSPLVAFPGWWV